MNKRPKLIVIAGPNGSGKSTLTEKFKSEGLDFGIYINADEIAKTLDGNDFQNAMRAQALAEEKRNELLDKQIAHSFETVMSHPSKVEYIITARNKGFHVILLFVGINDPKINVSRVNDRVKKGGHDVPTDKIVSRYKRTMELLFDAAMEADEALVFDNTNSARGLQLAAEIKGKNLVSHDTRFPWVQKYLVSKIKS